MNQPSSRRALARGILLLAAVPLVARAGYRDDLGYTRLLGEIGAALPTGAGVAVSQVEAQVEVNGQQTWMPDPNNAEFTGKTITQVYPAPAGIYSGHATAVAQYFYGNYQSNSPAITSITSYWASRWVVDDFLWPPGTAQPLSSASRVVNHSWVGTTGSTSSDLELLHRIDWVVENDDQLHVAAYSTGANSLLASAFNVIAVGDGDASGTGSTGLDGIYTAGRARPDVVAPSDTPSIATAMVSSLVAMLVEEGHADGTLSTDLAMKSYTNRAGLVIRNAERSEVIKAALMAGADRVTHNTAAADLARYRDAGHQSSNGLDIRYGAGQVDVYNSYRIIASGEQNSAEDGGPASGTATRGFDYDRYFGGSSGSNSIANYPLPVAQTAQLLTATLVSQMHINGGTANNFNGTATLRDMSLAVVDVTNAASPVVVYTSQSTTEATENAWLVVPANAHYSLRVSRVGTTSYSHDYALAWQLLPDSDADGVSDEHDNCILDPNGPMIGDAGGRSQFDADGDGYGNLCDADLNNSGLVTSNDYSILRSSLNTSDPVSDLNGSGLVTTVDYNLARASLNTAPGPSGVTP
jgi:hypothetical protein